MITAIQHERGHKGEVQEGKKRAFDRVECSREKSRYAVSPVTMHFRKTLRNQPDLKAKCFDSDLFIEKSRQGCHLIKSGDTVIVAMPTASAERLMQIIEESSSAMSQVKRMSWALNQIYGDIHKKVAKLRVDLKLCGYTEHTDNALRSITRVIGEIIKRADVDVNGDYVI